MANTSNEPFTPPPTTTKTSKHVLIKKSKVGAAKRKASEITASPEKNVRWFRDRVLDDNDRDIAFQSYIGNDASRIPKTLTTMAKELRKADDTLRSRKMDLHNMLKMPGYEKEPQFAIILQEVTNMECDQYFKRDALQTELSEIPGLEDITVKQSLDLIMLTSYFGYNEQHTSLVNGDVHHLIQQLIMKTQDTNGAPSDDARVGSEQSNEQGAEGEIGDGPEGMADE
jgi:hypothetical protein